MIELLGRKAVSAEVEPEQVRAFGLDERYFRQMLCEERFRLLVVLLEIVPQRFEPRQTFLVGSLRGEHAECVRLAVACVVNRRAELLPHRFVLDEDV